LDAEEGKKEIFTTRYEDLSTQEELPRLGGVAEENAVCIISSCNAGTDWYSQSGSSVGQYYSNVIGRTVFAPPFVSGGYFHQYPSFSGEIPFGSYKFQEESSSGTEQGSFRSTEPVFSPMKKFKPQTDGIYNEDEIPNP